MPWIIWFIHFCCGAKSKRDRHSKSAGCKCFGDCCFTFKRFFKTCIVIHIDCIAACMVFYEQLAAGFCISHQYQLVGVCCSRYYCSFDCIDHCKHSICKSSDCKPCEIIANRVVFITSSFIVSR